MFHRLFIVTLLFTFAGACGPLTFTIGSRPSEGVRQTIVKDEGVGVGDRVALIDISGFLLTSASRGILSISDSPVGYLHERLEAARTDRRVKAVILRINTPGGTVTASDAMHREIRRFRELSGKPVVALMLDVAASGGYYLSCAADRIIAYPTSITGSIGVIVQTFSVKGLLDRWDIHTDAIVSGPNKDIASPLGRMTAEERAILQAMVDGFYARFVSIVKAGRPGITADDLPTVTDGRIFTGEQALKLGLVDATGDLYDAFATARQLAGIQRAHLVLLHRPGYAAGSAYATGPGAPATQINLAQINLHEPLNDATRTFLYLWQP